MALSEQELAAAVWQSLKRIGGKEVRREKLAAGQAYKVFLAVDGTVQERAFHQRADVLLSVGHDFSRAGTAKADVERVLDVVMSKLNATIRESLIRDLPDEFGRNKQKLPAVDPEITKGVKSMLKRLRTRTKENVTGVVGCTYRLLGDEPPVGQ